jgi:hypothetical protein
MRDVIHSGEPTRMYSDVIYSFAIGFVGAILFLLVDKHEPDGPMARLLKFLILFVASVAILHKLQPYGLALLRRLGSRRCSGARDSKPGALFKPNKIQHPAIIATHNSIVGWTWEGMPWTTTSAL